MLGKRSSMAAYVSRAGVSAMVQSFMAAIPSRFISEKP
jgi:hypothetical protein